MNKRLSFAWLVLSIIISLVTISNISPIFAPLLTTVSLVIFFNKLKISVVAYFLVVLSWISTALLWFGSILGHIDCADHCVREVTDFDNTARQLMTAFTIGIIIFTFLIAITQSKKITR